LAVELPYAATPEGLFMTLVSCPAGQQCCATSCLGVESLVSNKSNLKLLCHLHMVQVLDPPWVCTSSTQRQTLCSNLCIGGQCTSCCRAFAVAFQIICLTGSLEAVCRGDELYVCRQGGLARTRHCADTLRQPPLSGLPDQEHHQLHGHKSLQ